MANKHPFRLGASKILISHKDEADDIYAATFLFGEEKTRISAIIDSGTDMIAVDEEAYPKEIEEPITPYNIDKIFYGIFPLYGRWFQDQICLSVRSCSDVDYFYIMK